MNIEIIGFIGSAIIALSLMMSELKKLRVFNLVGCTIMVIYATFNGLIPVIIINVFCILINMYYLIMFKNVKK